MTTVKVSIVPAELQQRRFHAPGRRSVVRKRVSAIFRSCMMKVRARSAMVRPVRWDRFPEADIPDSYKQPDLAPALAVCPGCHAVYLRGRWQWRAVPPGAASVTCSACHRIADNMPAARLCLEGDFEAKHRAEILGLVQHRVQRLQREHAMDRVMNVASDETGTVITTTGVHAARDIGTAIHRAYGGKLQFDYGHGQSELRVRWHRP
ncbi:BCAM0308 family protein [Pandoraea sputorum]|uniref:BCAM0308 family protein n=1 Tax=Pandoraea sputorum TaxID=93222 RepID=UPI0030C6D270